MYNHTGKLVTIREHLLRLETATADAVAARGHDLLQKLVDHARRNVLFYAGRLPAPDEIGEAGRWARVALLRRTDVEEHLDALSAATLPLHCGAVSTGQTSGSSGRALQYRHDAGFALVNAGQSDRIFTIWDFDGRKKLATFMTTYDDPRKRDLRRYGWRYGCPDGVREILELSNDIGAQLDWLKEVKVDYLFARGGAHLEELVHVALSRGDDLRFDKIISGSSRLTEQAVAATQKAFGAPIIDLYGASETGLIGYTCPDCGLMHTCDETMLVELLREDDSPCEPGEIGRVVVTPLYSYAMPLIRYEVGDYAIKGPATAPCGRPFGSLGAITGRQRSSFVLRDGRIIHPYVNARRIGEHLAYRQIQIVQTDFERVEIRYVPKHPSSPRQGDATALQDFFRHFMPNVEVELVAVDHFALDANGKFEETISLVPRGGEPVSNLH